MDAGSGTVVRLRLLTTTDGARLLPNAMSPMVVPADDPMDEEMVTGLPTLRLLISQLIVQLVPVVFRISS